MTLNIRIDVSEQNLRPDQTSPSGQYVSFVILKAAFDIFLNFIYINLYQYFKNIQNVLVI